MIVKAAGIILICASSTLAGLYLSMKEDFRISDLSELKKGLIILKSEIEFALNILPDALNNISERTSGDISRFFKNLSDKLSDEAGRGLFDLWSGAVRESLSKSRLEKQDFENLERLGKTLGYLDKNLQLNSIDYLIDYIDETTIRLSAAGEKNKRMYRNMGIICGLLVSIILI